MSDTLSPITSIVEASEIESPLDGIVNEARENLRVRREQEGRNVPKWLEKSDELAMQTFREILEGENLVERLVEEVLVRQTVYRNKVDLRYLESMLYGHTLEAVALNELRDRHDNESGFAELEEFLLMSLKDPRLWAVDFDNLEKLPKKHQEKVKSYLSSEKYKKLIGDETRSLRNNDGVAISIEEDAQGHRKAVITGLVEVKGHMISRGGDARQRVEGPRNLHKLVTEFKEIYPVLVESLGLSDILPQEIDIVGLEELSYEVVHPRDVELDITEKFNPDSVREAMEEYKQEQDLDGVTILGVRKEQLHAMKEALRAPVIDALPNDNSLKIYLRWL